MPTAPTIRSGSSRHGPTPADAREFVSFVLYVGSGFLIVGLSRRLEKNTKLPTFTLRLGSLAFVGTAILYGLCIVLTLGSELFVGESPIDGILTLVFTVAYLLATVVSLLEWLATLTGRMFAYLYHVGSEA